MGRSFLFIHGLEGSAPGHWQRWLEARLREAGEDVRFPELPEPFAPSLDDWHAVLDAELAALPPGERVVLCHSLGSILWLHHARDPRPEDRVTRTLLIAPPSAGAGLPELEPFFPVDLGAVRLAAAAEATRLVGSDADPYCPEGPVALYGSIAGVEAELVPGGGHLNTDAGYGPWPAVEAWALGAPSAIGQPVGAPNS